MTKALLRISAAGLLACLASCNRQSNGLPPGPRGNIRIVPVVNALATNDPALAGAEICATFRLQPYQLSATGDASNSGEPVQFASTAGDANGGASDSGANFEEVLGCVAGPIDAAGYNWGYYVTASGFALCDGTTTGALAATLGTLAPVSLNAPVLCAASVDSSLSINVPLVIPVTTAAGYVDVAAGISATTQAIDCKIAEVSTTDHNLHFGQIFSDSSGAPGAHPARIWLDNDGTSTVDQFAGQIKDTSGVSPVYDYYTTGIASSATTLVYQTFLPGSGAINLDTPTNASAVTPASANCIYQSDFFTTTSQPQCISQAVDGAVATTADLANAYVESASGFAAATLRLDGSAPYIDVLSSSSTPLTIDPAAAPLSSAGSWIAGESVTSGSTTSSTPGGNNGTLYGIGLQRSSVSLPAGVSGAINGLYPNLNEPGTFWVTAWILPEGASSPQLEFSELGAASGSWALGQPQNVGRPGAYGVASDVFQQLPSSADAACIGLFGVGPSCNAPGACTLLDACPGINGVYQSTYVASSDADVQTFFDWGCHEIKGDLIVSSGVTNLSKFSRLLRVDGSIDLTKGSTETSLAGLDHLTGVGGYLAIKNSTNLASAILPALSAIGGSAFASTQGLLAAGLNSARAGQLDVQSNSGLASLQAPALASVAGNVVVGQSPALATLALSALQSVGGKVDIENDGALTSIDLSSLSTVGSDPDQSHGFLLSNNPILPSISLPALTSIAGTVDWGNDQALTSISINGRGPTTFGIDFRIHSQPMLTTLGFGGTTSIGGSIFLTSSARLTSITASQLATVGGSLFMNQLGSSGNGTPSLDLSTLSTVGGWLLLSNTAFTSFALPALTSVGAAGQGQNPGLVSISSDAALASVTLGSGAGSMHLTNLLIHDNPVLGAISLQGAVSLAQSLDVERNAELETVTISGTTDVSGVVVIGGSGASAADPASSAFNLSGLHSVGQFLQITTDPSVASIDLTGLRTVGTNLILGGALGRSGTSFTAGNANLASVSLSSITVGGNIDIQSDPMLETVAIGGSNSSAADVYISGNGGSLALPASGTYDLSGLATVGNNFDLEADPVVAALSVPGLTAVGTAPLSLGGNLVIATLPELTALNFTDLATIAGQIFISHNATLASVAASSLHFGSGFHIVTMAFDPMLPPSQVVSIASSSGAQSYYNVCDLGGGCGP